jgi:hypothetical protein
MRGYILVKEMAACIPYTYVENNMPPPPPPSLEGNTAGIFFKEKKNRRENVETCNRRLNLMGKIS